MIGHLSRDVVAGGEPRIGGGPWHAARALRALDQRGTIVAKCGEAERRLYHRRLVGCGLPAGLAVGGETTGFSMSYDGSGARTMVVDALGEPWRVTETFPALLRGVPWLHVAPLLRGELDAGILAALAPGRRILLDGQGLVRVPRLGPLVLDCDFDPEVLRHVTMLKLAEEEARALVGEVEAGALTSLGVPEVIVTFGLEGSLVVAGGVATPVRARPVHADPTGAGDAFAVAYLSARAHGHPPVPAARRATALVASLLTGRVR